MPLFFCEVDAAFFKKGNFRSHFFHRDINKRLIIQESPPKKGILHMDMGVVFGISPACGGDHRFSDICVGDVSHPRLGDENYLGTGFSGPYGRPKASPASSDNQDVAGVPQNILSRHNSGVSRVYSHFVIPHGLLWAAKIPP